MTDMRHNKYVLVIDDSTSVCAKIKSDLIVMGYTVLVANNGMAGIALIRSRPLDIVLVDLNMPEVDGREVIRFAASTFPLLPVIVISSTEVLQDVIESMRFGAWDFISKARMQGNHLHQIMTRCLERAEKMRHSEVSKRELEALVDERAEALAASHERLKKLQRATVESLSRITAMHNSYTGSHQIAVASISRRIAQRMGYDAERVNAVEVAGLLHDIGHLGVPSEFLSKPGRLTDLEWAFVHRHPRTSYEVLSAIPFEYPIADMILQHHERMDGSGYPDHITGDAILPEARILAVADMMEAMLTHRPYRAATTLDELQRVLRNGRGVLYCPDVADIALEMIENATSIQALLQGQDNEN